MAVRKIGRRREIGVEPMGPTLLLKWVLAKIKADDAKAEQELIRPQLVKMFDEVEPDNSGHRRIDLVEPIEGYTHIQYQRRVSNKEDREAVMKALEKYDLVERCTVVSRVPDEEEIMRAVYDGALPESEIAVMYPATVTHAVVVKRG
jgi:hypothetical protein